MPASVFAADLQITDLSDSGYDPSPAGSSVVYSVTVENGAADTVTDGVAVFDLPSGTAAGALPSFCAVDTTVSTRVRCNLPTLIGTQNANGSPLTFQIVVNTAGHAPGSVSMTGAIGFAAGTPAPTTPLTSLTSADAFYAGDTNAANNRRTEGTTLENGGDLRIAKTGTPDPVVGGGEVTYTITVTNDGPSISTNFNVADTLPAQATYVANSFAGAGWTFNAGTTTATHAGALAVGATSTFTFRAKVNAGSGNIINSATVNAVGTPDPNPSNNTAQAQTAVTPGADLSLSKTAAPVPAISGEPITFTLTARNLGPSAATNASITDAMPAGFVITGTAPPAGWTCNTATDTRTCTRGTPMPAGAVETFTIQATVPSSGANSSGDVTNTASITSATPDPNGPDAGINNNTGVATFTVLADGTDLSLAKAKSPAIVAVYSGVGDDSDSRMTSTINVRNEGPRAATGQVQVVDELAAGEEYLSSPSANWTCTATAYAAPPARQRVTCDLNPGSLPLAVNGNAPALNLVTRAVVAGNLSNQACTGGSGGSIEPLTGNGINVDPVTDNDCNGAGTRTTAERADLRIAKRTNGVGTADNTVTASQLALSYTLDITNDGPDATAGIVVNDIIPGWIDGRSSATFVQPAGWTCAQTNGSVVCRSNNTALAVGQSAQITINVNRPLRDSAGLGAGTCGGVATNNAFCNTAGLGVDATVPGAVGEVNTSNNQASDFVQIDRRANVRTVAKNITTGATGRAGVNTTYQMAFINEGPAAVPGVVFRDTLDIPANDAGFVLISAARTGAAPTACTVAVGPGITATPAAGGTSYANPTGATSNIRVSCAPLTLSDQETQTLTVTIRPNVNTGNTGRTFNDVADFILDRNNDGTADAPSGTDANGTFDFNTDTSTADDTKSASLPFNMGSVDLITNKVDTGFAGGIDPLGYDGVTPANNVITYRVTVRNNGPSAATNVRIADTITPATGRTVAFLGAALAPNGPLNTTSCTVAAGANPTTGAAQTLDCLMPGVGFSPNVDGSVASGQTSTLYLRYEYQTAPGASGDTLQNRAVASSNETDTNAVNNVADQETTIRARADLSVQKTAVLLQPDADPAVALPATTATVTLRQPFYYAIDSQNLGPGSSLSRDRSGSSPLNGTGTVVTDTLPAGLVVTGPITWRKAGPSVGGDEVPNGTGTCAQNGQVVTCAVGDMTVTGRVRIIVPARWDAFPAGGTTSNTATVATEQVDTVTGNNTSTSTVAVTRSSLAGVVYEDRDRSAGNGGTRQAGTEPGIGGVTITLTGTDAYGNAVNRTTTTAADGTYAFTDLSPSNPAGYAVTETQPAGIQNGPVDPPAAGPQAASLGGTYAVGTPNSTYTAVAVGANDTGVRYDFPEVARPSLSGFVYLDVNSSDTRNAGDTGIGGATVELLNAATGAVIATTTTAADGSYAFTNLDPLVLYTLREPLPANVLDRPTAINPGTIGGAACTGCTVGAGVGGDAATTDRISGIDLSSGQSGSNFNFGEMAPVSIAGTVYLDLNNNGSKDNAAETGLAGVTFDLTGTDDLGNPVAATTTSDANGNWSFPGLRPGTYTVTEPNQPTGTGNGITRPGTVNGTASGVATPVATTPSVVSNVNLLTPGSSSINNLFGELPLNSAISGRVFLDTDNDGIVDATETGIAAVTVTLTGTDSNGNAISRTTTTAADGSYAFTDLPPGTYTVAEPTQPADTLSGLTRAGTGGGNATPPTTVPSTITGITLGVGTSAVNNNFGEIPGGSIAGRVYADNDDDGVVDPGEGGIAGVTIVLTGTDDLGQPVNVTVVTDGNGMYTFPGLRPGTYTVTEPTQPPETLNGITTAGTLNGVPEGSATPRGTLPSAISGIVITAGASSIENNFGEIGDSPDLVVSKAATPTTFTANNVGTYTITVRNVGQQPTAGDYTVEDRLPAGLTLASTPVGTGWTCTGAAGADRFTCSSSTSIAIGATGANTIVARVNVAAAAATGTPVNNAVLVQGGGENESRQPTPAERAAFEGNPADLPVCDPAITQNACRLPTAVQLSASVSGTVWFESGSTNGQLDGGDRRLAGWLVEVVDATGTIVGTATTNADGTYAIANQIPGVPLSIRFRDPAAGTLWGQPVNGESGTPVVPCTATPAPGTASSCGSTDGGISHLAVVLVAGQNLPQQSLPLNPGGVVYDSTTRDPVRGAVVTLTPIGTCAGYVPATSLLNAAAGGYTINGDAVSMTVGSDGFYQFLMSPTAPASCSFQLTVTPPGGYLAPSTAIPAETNALNAPNTPGVAFAVQPNATAPTGAPGTGTQYYLQLTLGSAVAAVVHDHLPLDPQVAPGLVIVKVGDRKTVEVGDTLLYSISIRQTAGSSLGTVNIIDRLPPGFTFIAGTARVDGAGIANPLGQPGPTLVFNVGALGVGGQKTLTYRVRVGVGSQQGDGTNRARGYGCSIDGGCVDPNTLAPYTGGGVVTSNPTEFKVRVSGGVFADEGCVLGKVFVDCNANSVQDREELGIGGVRMYFEDGTWMVSDSEGKYSYCGLPPKSHTLKIDGSTLPVGSHMTTSSNRNLGDADSLFIDLKNGELHRADFIEGSCSNAVIEQVKARRTQGEVRAPETETGHPALKFESKPRRASQQPTDSANQAPIIAPRSTTEAPVPPAAAQPEVQP